MDLSTGAILATVPEVTGTDIEAFNPMCAAGIPARAIREQQRRAMPWDEGQPQVFPALGVFAAPTGPQQIATLVGVECSGGMAMA